MNKAIEIGRLVRDPELRKTTNERSVCSFTIAVQRDNKRDEADFLNVTAWGKDAENVSRYLKKGAQVAILGAIRTRSYEDRQGNKRTAWEIVADQVQFLDSKTQTAPDVPDMTPDPFDEDLPF